MKKVVLFAGVLLSIPLTTETVHRKRKNNSRSRTPIVTHTHNYYPSWMPHWGTPSAQPAQPRPTPDNNVNNASERPGYNTSSRGLAYDTLAPEETLTGTQTAFIPAMRPGQAPQAPLHLVPQQDG